MGNYNGAVSQLKRVRLWLLIINCVNHRLELAVKDGLKEDPAFTEVSEVLLALYYLKRSSGKVKSLLTKIAIELDVVCVAIKALIVDCFPMYLLMENYTCAGSKLGDSSMRSKMVNWFELFRKYKFLASVNFFYKTLKQTAHLAYVIKAQLSCICDIKDAMQDCIDELENLREEETSLPFESEKVGGDLLIRPVLTNLPATKKFKESNEKAGSSSTGVLIHHEYKVTDVKNGKATVLKIKDNILPDIIASIKSRFESFEDEIYQSVIAICDHRRWDYEDNSYGVKDIAALYEHFQDPSSENDFNKDLAVKEFKDIRRIVKHQYRHLTPQQMWESIITNHSVNHRHIAMLGELIFCIEWASSTVERGFSIANRMLVPSRKSLSKKRLNNLLMLRVNVPILSTLDPHYEEKLIAKAVELYTPNKYHNTKSVMSAGG